MYNEISFPKLQSHFRLLDLLPLLLQPLRLLLYPLYQGFPLVLPTQPLLRGLTAYLLLRHGGHVCLASGGVQEHLAFLLLSALGRLKAQVRSQVEQEGGLIAAHLQSQVHPIDYLGSLRVTRPAMGGVASYQHRGAIHLHLHEEQVRHQEGLFALEEVQDGVGGREQLVRVQGGEQPLGQVFVFKDGV